MRIFSFRRFFSVRRGFETRIAGVFEDRRLFIGFRRGFRALRRYFRPRRGDRQFPARACGASKPFGRRIWATFSSFYQLFDEDFVPCDEISAAAGLCPCSKLCACRPRYETSPAKSPAEMCAAGSAPPIRPFSPRCDKYRLGILRCAAEFSPQSIPPLYNTFCPCRPPRICCPRVSACTPTHMSP